MPGRSPRTMRPAVLARSADVDRVMGPDAAFLVGVDSVTLDGEPFPWPTVGDWVLRLGEDELATLEVRIAVTIPPEPTQGRLLITGAEDAG